jgi:hypothetical protein
VSLSGTRGLIRVSKNPDCELQAAMAVRRVRELDFFRSVTGENYPKEYGERVAARRRGSKFEAHLHENNAAELRRAVAPVLGYNPDTMVVRNFADEVPGPVDTMRAVRLTRTRRVLQDLVAGREVPHILIQPQLSLPTGSPGCFEYVSPDFAVLDPRSGFYKPGEEKSFIVRDNVADPADLDLTRRQAAAQILALRFEAGQLGVQDRVSNSAIFVMATPFGLRAADPAEEALDGAILEVKRALKVIDGARRRLEALERDGGGNLSNLVDDLGINVTEGCHQSCVMAEYCYARAGETPALLGDTAARLFAGMDLDHVRDLVVGAVDPADADEQALLDTLLEASLLVGIQPVELRRRLA